MTGKAGHFARAPRRWPLLALLAALAVPVPALSVAAPPQHAHVRSGKIHIGRIFFSPAERHRRNADKTPGADSPRTAHAARGDGMKIDGAVSSSTQGRAVWVNGAVIESSKFKSVWTDRAGRVWLSENPNTPRLVRPGQTINPASGAVEDLLPAGSVARH